MAEESGLENTGSAKVVEAIDPYIPLIKVARELINKIVESYESAEYNKNICETLVYRVKLTEDAIDMLLCRKYNYEVHLCNNNYYIAFNRFIYVFKRN